MTSGATNSIGKLDGECQQLLKMAITELNLSARAYDRILKVARTMVDLDRAECIQPQHNSKDDNAVRSIMDEYWRETINFLKACLGELRGTRVGRTS